MTDINAHLPEFILALADDQLILGQRDAEWCSRAPILEEDIAFANIALDEIGHASTWYGLLAQLINESPEQYPDRLVYFREPADFRNVQMAELPRGDFAFAMLRQHLLDTAEILRLERLAGSPFAPLATVAGKLVKEEIYHQYHTRAWLPRLGLGTEESHSRLQRALNELWPYVPQVIAPLPGENELLAAGLLSSDNPEFQPEWEQRVLPLLQQCELDIPALPKALPPSRHQHTSHLKTLLADLQAVRRLDPEAQW